MAEPIGERVARLEEKVEQNTEDIEKLKGIGQVVNELTNNIEKLSDTVNTVSQSVELLAKTTDQINQARHDAELLMKNSIWYKIKTKISNAGIKEWVIIALLCSMALTGLCRYILSFF